MDDVLRRLAAEIEDFTARLREQPVAVRVKPREVRAWLATRYDFARPVPLSQLLLDTARALRRWTVHTTHPRHFGLFAPAVARASIVGDALAALVNPQLATWQAAPAAVEIEQHVLAALAPRFGLDLRADATAPARGFACFTTGGAESNLTALVCALTRALPDYPARGLSAAAPLRPAVYLSDEGHPSVHKAARVAGLGTDAVRAIASDAALRLDTAALAAQIARDRAAGHLPVLIVATAGTTSAGAIDPIAPLADLAARERVWLHVDAAYGGVAALSPRLAPALAGIERADSVAFDAHKALPVAMGAGMYFCRHPATVRDAFAVRAPYMPRADEPDGRAQPYATTLQWSRRFIGLKVFLTLAERGLPAIAQAIDRQCALADRLRARLTACGFQLLNDTPLPVVCFTHPRIESGTRTPREILTALYRTHTAWLGETVLQGRAPALRACVGNELTDETDIDALADALEAAVQA